MLGVFLAIVSTRLPTWTAHLVPWGYYSLATPAAYRGQVLVWLAPAHASIAALGVVAAAAFVAVTHRLDRKET